MDDTTNDTPKEQPSIIGDEPDLDAMFQAAARGDHNAQAALALNAQQHGLDGLVPIGEAFACAELFARMAATSGKVEHVMVLARVLASRYDILDNVGLDDGALPPLTEYYLLMKIAADAGDASAALSLKTMADIITVAPIVDEMWAEILQSAEATGQENSAADTTAELDAHAA